MHVKCTTILRRRRIAVEMVSTVTAIVISATTLTATGDAAAAVRHADVTILANSVTAIVIADDAAAAAADPRRVGATNAIVIAIATVEIEIEIAQRLCRCRCRRLVPLGVEEVVVEVEVVVVVDVDEGVAVPIVSHWRLRLFFCVKKTLNKILQEKKVLDGYSSSLVTQCLVPSSL